MLYNVNDLVLIKNEEPSKMDALYFGPYKVVRDITPNVEIIRNEKLDTVQTTKLFHF